jgi:hypothetical protein
MTAAIGKWGIGDATSQVRELLWQKRVEGDSAKIKQFQEVAGALQDYKTYLFPKKGSVFWTVMHSPMKFVALSDATQHLQERFIGFVGDRTLTRELTAIQRGGDQSSLRTGYAPGQGEYTPRRVGSGYQGQYGGGGQGYIGNTHQGPAGAYQGGGPPQGGPPSNRDWCTGWNDQRNPKIKVIMQPYLERTVGRIHLAEIFDAAGKRQTDLPTLKKYVHATGRPFLCWSSVLGRCTFRDCWFKKEGGHPSPTDVTDEFADQVIDVVNKGIVTLCSPGGGSPPKKQKPTEATRPDN